MKDHRSYITQLKQLRKLSDTGAALYQLSYQANWELVIVWIRYIPVEEMRWKWIYENLYIWTAEERMNKWMIIAVLYTQLKQLRKESLKTIQAWTGFEPMTSATAVQRSTNWAVKPPGSWSLCEFVIYPLRRWDESEYMKIYTFELRKKEWISEWSSQLYTQLKQLRKESLKKSLSSQNFFEAFFSQLFG